MEMTQEELEKLVKIKNAIKRILKENQKYERLITRKEQILNYLITIQENEKKKEQIKEYEKIGNDIKEITEAEAFEIMNSYAHVELPEMKPVKDFPMN